MLLRFHPLNHLLIRYLLIRIWIVKSTLLLESNRSNSSLVSGHNFHFIVGMIGIIVIRITFHSNFIYRECFAEHCIAVDEIISLLNFQRIFASLTALLSKIAAFYHEHITPNFFRPLLRTLYDRERNHQMTNFSSCFSSLIVFVSMIIVFHQKQTISETTNQFYYRESILLHGTSCAHSKT